MANMLKPVDYIADSITKGIDNLDKIMNLGDEYAPRLMRISDYLADNITKGIDNIVEIKDFNLVQSSWKRALVSFFLSGAVAVSVYNAVYEEPVANTIEELVIEREIITADNIMSQFGIKVVGEV